jgi:hypothetical protein
MNASMRRCQTTANKALHKLLLADSRPSRFDFSGSLNACYARGSRQSNFGQRKL